MTLFELSKLYRANAGALQGRIMELQALSPETPEGERAGMEERIKILSAMWREARDIAVLCERYYERGYRRNGRYTL